jgi:hypothetical protein
MLVKIWKSRLLFLPLPANHKNINMKPLYEHLIIIGSLILLTLLLTLAVNSSRNIEIATIEVGVSGGDSTYIWHKNYTKKQQAIVDSVLGRIQDNFDYVFPKFQKFNSNIDTATVTKFAQVLYEFKLDSTDYHRKMYTGQILAESGAKQYREDGSLVVGLAGEIGMCQIKASTCLDYLTKHADSLDREGICFIGASDFSFAYDKSIYTGEKIKKTREWLTVIDNNIIMWGFITKHDLKKKKTIHKQLVAYNMGSTGMYRFLNNGGSLKTHKYIRKIKHKILVSSH